MVPEGQEGAENQSFSVHINSAKPCQLDIEKFNEKNCESSSSQKIENAISEEIEEEAKDANSNSVVVQVRGDDVAKHEVNGDGISDGDQKICRICHLGLETSSSEMIKLGCGCKKELGIAHLSCAQTWFKQRGNRICEICEKTAINVSGVDDSNNVRLLIEWDDMRLRAAAATTISSPPVQVREGMEEFPEQCKRTFRNVVMACLLLAFTVPYLFQIKIF